MLYYVRGWSYGAKRIEATSPEQAAAMYKDLGGEEPFAIEVFKDGEGFPGDEPLFVTEGVRP